MSNLSKDQTVREVANMLFGTEGDNLIAKMDDRSKRKMTAGLSAVGAGAGALGLAAAGNEIRTRAKEIKEATPEVNHARALAAGFRKTPRLTKLLLPAEVVGLGGEVMSTKILHNDSKKPVTKPKSAYTLAKMDPGGSDLHVPGKGDLKRKAVKEAEPLARKEAIKVKHGVLNQVPKLGGKTLTATKKKVDDPFGKRDEAPMGGLELEMVNEFSKVDEDKRQVFGWASIVKKDGEHVVDLQGDYIDIDEIEKSAYDYVIKSRHGGDMHARNGEKPKVVGTMIESFLVTPEKVEKMGLPDDTPLGWWVGYQVEDPEVWEMVKSGKRTGFSIHGRGQRTPAMI